MKIEMIANKGFSNPKIEGPRSDGSVLPGEGFKTEWLHGKELHASGLAKAKNPGDLDQEPSDPVEPHSSLSAPEHVAINDRRAGLRATKDSAAKGAADAKGTDGKTA